MDKNQLYYGDNLQVLREHVKDESVDLVYLDPPFNSNATYNVLFKEQDGSKAASQIKAFGDTWQWDEAAASTYFEVVEQGGQVSKALQAFRGLVGDSTMLAYLSMMAPRLVELRRVLKPTGSIYLHCDPTAGHYLKLLMDAVFGTASFKNELVWHYKKFEMRKMRQFTRNSDRLLFYVKDPDSDYLYNPQCVPLTTPKQYKRKAWNSELKRIVNVRDSEGRLIYDTYHDEKVDDVWEIPFIGATAKERLGYPTQKPEALLERIIQASSNEGDLVLDPFCGCGTAVAVAQRLKRQWIGIDVTYLAVALIRRRLRDQYGDEIDGTYDVIGEPVSVPDAQELAHFDPYQFQWWALDLVHARPAEQKKGADKGIDGRIYFHEGDGETKQIILSVKAGHTGRAHVHELRGVIEREQAAIGVLISMQEPTGPMREEAASAGYYESPWGRHSRLQLLTVGDLLEGKRIDCPPQSVSMTFKKAARHTKKQGEQMALGGDAAE